jgi:LysR family transcriptional activator of nhaA
MKIQIGSKVIWINYHHLYCFWVVGNEGSLAKASQKLGIGQSALSIQIKQFEENIGFALYDRSHRKLSMNESGLIVFSYAKEIFRLGNEMMESIHDRPLPHRVHLQLGALDTIPKHLSLKLAKSALATGRCSITIVEGKPADLLKDLSEHKIDLVITNSSPNAIAPNLYSKRIAKLPLWVVGSSRFKKLKNQFPLSLNNQPVILPTIDSSVRHEIESYFKKAKVQPDYLAEAQDVMIQKLLALDGVGMTVVPELAVQEYVDQKKLYLIGKLENAFEDLFLVSATRKIENPIASEIMRSFKID